MKMTEFNHIALSYFKVFQPTTQYPVQLNTTHNTEHMCSDEWQTTLEYISSIGFILPAITLAIFNIIVVGGNLLVIISVFSCRKLRTITNTYIVSLAFSDLFLGVLVLPFSGTNEVLQHWIFGDIWCDMWLAVDVWICTASILNLCAISFDRYLAISRPFKYQTLVSPVKAKVLVTTVWVVAFLICLPPLIGWNERGTSILDEVRSEQHLESIKLINYTISNQTHNISTRGHIVYFHDVSLTSYISNNITNKVDNCPKLHVCELTAEPGYIIYSALGSFWIPVWVMVFFYGRIYMIAAKTTKGVKRGVIHTKSNGSNSASSPVTLRIHRGGTFNSSVTSHSSSNRPSISQTESLLPSPAIPNGERVRQHSFCETEDAAAKLYRQLKRNASVPAEMGSNGAPSSGKPPKIKVTFCRSTRGKNQFARLEEYPGPYKNNGRVHCPIEEETSFNMSETCMNDSDPVENGRRTPRRSNIRTKLRTFNREKKAAKTVGIIVGCFIFCWAPFFTVYLLGAICSNCTPKLMFSVFFWLGYSNSAINPFVYALFSKDFRFAFKKLLTCRCERQKLTFKDRRQSRLRTFFNSLKIQISSRSSDDTNCDTTCD